MMTTIWLLAFGFGDVRAQIAQALEGEFGLRVDAEHVEMLELRHLGKEAGERLKLSASALRFDRTVETYLWPGQSLDAVSGRTAPMRVRFRLPKLGEEVRTREAVKARQVLSEKDVEKVACYWNPAEPRGRFARFSTVLGRETKSNLAAGRRLLASDVAILPVVRSGETVQVMQRVGTAVLRFPAVSLKAGRVGEEIPVRQTGDFRQRRARIAGPGLVSIGEVQ